MLTRRLHGLVNGQACARVARSIGLGEALRMPDGETRRGARALDTILGDACEALIAALYLEFGLTETTAIVLRLWSPLMSEPHEAEVVDPKSILQEWAAAHGPRSAGLSAFSSDRARTTRLMFTLEARVEGEAPEMASATAVRAAEKAAALALLRRLRRDP